MPDKCWCGKDATGRGVFRHRNAAGQTTGWVSSGALCPDHLPPPHFGSFVDRGNLGPQYPDWESHRKAGDPRTQLVQPAQVIGHSYGTCPGKHRKHGDFCPVTHTLQLGGSKKLLVTKRPENHATFDQMVWEAWVVRDDCRWLEYMDHKARVCYCIPTTRARALAQLVVTPLGELWGVSHYAIPLGAFDVRHADWHYEEALSQYTCNKIPT